MPRGTAVIMAVLAVILATAVLFVGVDVVENVDQSTGDYETEVRTSTLLGSAGSYVTVGDGDATGTDETVLKSRGKALDFAGTDDSYLVTDSNVRLTADDTWSVTQGIISIDDNSSQQTILTVGDPDLYLEYHGSTGNFSAVWTGGVGSERVNVSRGGTDPPLTITVNRSGNNLSIYRNGTKGDSATVDTSDDAGGDLTAADNFDGALDETRVFNTSLNSSQRSALRNDPNDQLTTSERELRIMYDDVHRNDNTVQVFFLAGSATRSNASYVDGYPREVVSSGGTFGNGDYNWREDGPQLQPNTNGELDGAPVAYVDYLRQTGGKQVSDAFTEAVDIGALVPTVVMFAIIIMVLLRVRGRM